MSHHADLFGSIPHAKVSFESPPPSRTGNWSGSPSGSSLNSKYSDWVSKMKDWTNVNLTPDSNMDISESQRKKRSGLDTARFTKKSRPIASELYSRKVVYSNISLKNKSNSMNGSLKKGFRSGSGSSNNNPFLAEKLVINDFKRSLYSKPETDASFSTTGNGSSGLLDEIYQAKDDTEDQGILFFNDDIQELYGSDYELF